MSENQDTQTRSLSELLDRPVYDGKPDKDTAPVDDDSQSQSDTKTDDSVVDSQTTPDDKKISDIDADAASKDKTFKYKSWEAAETGAKEAQSWGTKKAQEAAEFRKQAEELKKELEEIRRKEAESKRPKPVSAEERATQIQQALDAIDALDPESPDYTAQRAKLLADALAQPDVPYVDEYTIQEKVREEVSRREAETRAQRTQTELIKEAEMLAKQAGLNMSRDSYDHKMFWDALSRAPMGEGVTLEQQVEVMVSEVKGLKDTLYNDWLSGLSDAQKKQIKNTPLEKGSTGRLGDKPPVEVSDEEKPLTISAIMENQRNRRVI